MKTHLSLLRLVSIFFVVYNHTWIMGFQYYSVSQNPADIAVGIAFSAFCKIAVPLFFMISGALLLSKEESIHIILLKRVLRPVIVLIIVSVLYYLYNTGFSFPIQNSDLLQQFSTAQIHAPLWFLYVYIGFLIGLPFIRPIAQTLDRNKIIYATIVYSFLQLINFFSAFFAQWTVISYLTEGVLVSGDCVYFALLGHYLENVQSEEQYKSSWFYGVLVVLSTGVNAVLIYINGVLSGDMMSESAHKLMTCFIAFGMFALIKKWSFQWNLSGKKAKIINTLGGCVFGTYLLEGLTRPLTISVYHTLEAYIPGLLACWLWVILAVILGLIATLVLKRIPVVKELI